MSTTTARAHRFTRGKWGPRFSTRILLLQLGAVGLAVVLAAGAHLWLAYERLWTEAENDALTLARAIAADPALRSEVAAIAAREGTPAPSQLIWSSPLSSGHGEAPPGGFLAAPLCSAGGVVGERVVGRRAVRLICAGWLPQDGGSAGVGPRV